MELNTDLEFRNRATDILRSKEPVVITQHGKVAGVFLPTPDGQLPLDVRRQLFAAATEKLHKQREELGITDEQIEADIDELHRKRRAARSGR
jgi:hypothetical protein